MDLSVLFEQLINEHQLNKCVTLLGWVEDKTPFYKNLDVFCLSSREESFGLVVLEAMMHSLPLVLPELSGPLEIAKDAECALFVPPEDPVALSLALEQIITNNALAETLGSNSFKRVRDYETINIAPKLHASLEHIVNNSIHSPVASN